MSEIELNYLIFLTVLGTFMMVLMFFINISNYTYSRRQKKSFNLIFFLVGFLCIWDLASTLIEKNPTPELIIVDYIINFLGFAIMPSIPVLLANLMTSKKAKIWSYVAFGVYIIILLSLVCTHQLFYFDDTKYVRAIGFYAWYIPGIIVSFIYLIIIALILNIKNLSSHPVMLIVLVISLVGGMGAQIFLPDLHSTPISISAVTIFFYLYFNVWVSQTDGLTSLYSQYCFRQRLKNIKYGEIVFVLDINDFKMINDTYGHQKGDEILREVAKIIQQTFGKVGFCFRTGGDEFSVITKADIFAPGYIEQFKNIIASRKKDLLTSVSVGYHVFRRDEEDPFEVAKRADEEMYKDKRATKEKSNKHARR